MDIATRPSYALVPVDHYRAHRAVEPVVAQRWQARDRHDAFRRVQELAKSKPPHLGRTIDDWA